MKQFKHFAKKLFKLEKIPPYLKLMQENPKSKERLLEVFESREFNSEFMTGTSYYKPISKFSKNHE